MRFFFVVFALIALLVVGCGGTPSNSGTPEDIVKFADIPAGEFMMGCNETVDEECNEDEYPYHAVTLSAYKIGKYEVTLAEYQQCIDAGVCNNDGESSHYFTNTDNPDCDLGVAGKEKHPMQCVTWHGAKAYCEWIGGRLPTEAEWEKAARGTDGWKYPWGNEPAVSCDYAVMSDSNAGGHGCGTDSTMPVGSKPNGVSPYGAHDMIGNVWEWVNDAYSDTYYASSPTNDPTGPEPTIYYVLRGGSLTHRIDAYLLRASSRARGFSGYSCNFVGFRCAK